MKRKVLIGLGVVAIAVAAVLLNRKFGFVDKALAKVGL